MIVTFKLLCWREIIIELTLLKEFMIYVDLRLICNSFKLRHYWTTFYPANSVKAAFRRVFGGGYYYDYAQSDDSLYRKWLPTPLYTHKFI